MQQYVQGDKRQPKMPDNIMDRFDVARSMRTLRQDARTDMNRKGRHVRSKNKGVSEIDEEPKQQTKRWYSNVQLNAAVAETILSLKAASCWPGMPSLFRCNRGVSSPASSSAPTPGTSALLFPLPPPTCVWRLNQRSMGEDVSDWNMRLTEGTRGESQRVPSSTFVHGRHGDVNETCSRDKCNVSVEYRIRFGNGSLCDFTLRPW
jgi:hypothetical protein